MKKIFIFSLTFILCFISFVQPIYASSYPPVDDIFNSINYKTQEYVLYKYGNDYRLAIAVASPSNNALKVHPFINNGNLSFRVWNEDTQTIVTNSYFNTLVYQPDASNQWVQVSYFKDKFDSVDLASVDEIEYIQSSVPVLSYNSETSTWEDFFPAPLTAVPVLAEVAQGIPEVMIIQVQTIIPIMMMIVGCLIALLIVLPRFLKKLST